ncbi:hypothetical protein BKA67DRAFT_564909 [Truncatella angustata]|uniref:Uncharacterized protein n=1 Tax=Truncatella angustata TaxID=152316 RepID=A0A9P8ZXV1_9PEZI|nr:uncharacterized protein BKA67DRAFT_564909 [Truncatella angustata]KAH6654379.1 hypothetical protein BKA67DRAFT_564909 [Truncatella angustata]
MDRIDAVAYTVVTPYPQCYRVPPAEAPMTTSLSGQMLRCGQQAACANLVTPAGVRLHHIWEWDTSNKCPCP